MGTQKSRHTKNLLFFAGRWGLPSSSFWRQISLDLSFLNYATLLRKGRGLWHWHLLSFMRAIASSTLVGFKKRSGSPHGLDYFSSPASADDKVRRVKSSWKWGFIKGLWGVRLFRVQSMIMMWYSVSMKFAKRSPIRAIFCWMDLAPRIFKKWEFILGGTEGHWKRKSNIFTIASFN